MTDLRTTTSSASATGACPSDCKEAMNMVMEDVNKISRTKGAVERNAAITNAYRELGQKWPENDWIRLAGYVSTQGGCAMKKVQNGTIATALIPPAAPLFGEGLVNAQKALVDANTTIFSSVYPPNKFVRECGFQKLKECVESGEIEVNPQLMDALSKLNDGDRQGAADAMAFHEQVNVVQPVYERNQEGFDFMAKTEAWLPGDQTSIPIAYTCTRDDLVPFGNLSIQDPYDRVEYYHRLMNRMKVVEGVR